MKTGRTSTLGIAAPPNHADLEKPRLSKIYAIRRSFIENNQNGQPGLIVPVSFAVSIDFSDLDLVSRASSQWPCSMSEEPLVFRLAARLEIGRRLRMDKEVRVDSSELQAMATGPSLGRLI